MLASAVRPIVVAAELNDAISHRRNHPRDHAAFSHSWSCI